MKLLRVCLPNRKNFREELSYFASQEVKSGGLVSVPLNGKPTPGIVLSCEDVSDAKTELRHSNFQVKKIHGVIKHGFLSEGFMEAVATFASLHAQTIGDAIRVVLPSFFIDYPKLFSTGERKLKTNFEELMVQNDVETRISFYKTIIREEFAKKHSLLITCPLIQEAEALAAELSRGIEPFVFVLHSGVPEKEFKKRVQSIASTKHPVLIVGTPSYLHDLRDDISTLVVEHEGSVHYKTVQTPELDMRMWLQKYARGLKLKIIYADVALSPELVLRHEEKDIVEAMRLSWRLRNETPLTLIDMSSEKEAGSPILSVELLEKLDSSIRSHEHSVLYVARRGLYTITTCTNCNTILTCENCDKPFVLHEKTVEGRKVRFYLCHSCNNKRMLDDQHEVLCKQCGGWRLATFGIGTEHVKELLEERYGKKNVFIIDSDNATPAKAEKVSKAFYENKGGILVGTEMMLPYLTNPLATAGVVSFDSLFAIPDYNLNFKIVDIVETLRGKAKKNFLIQTRLKNEEIFSTIETGMLQEFYRNELGARRKLQYPPYSVFIRLIPRHGFSDRDLKRLPELCDGIGSVVFYKTRAKEAAALLRIDRAIWKDQKVREKITSMNGFAEITVNPSNIL